MCDRKVGVRSLPLYPQTFSSLQRLIGVAVCDGPFCVHSCLHCKGVSAAALRTVCDYVHTFITRSSAF